MTTPPTSALTLLRQGHTVARVIEWTGCSRWHLVQALLAEDMYVDRATDTAHPLPLFETGTQWRIWARRNGWPNLPDDGRLPAGLMDAYIAANPDDRVAVSSHKRAQNRDRGAA